MRGRRLRDEPTLTAILGAAGGVASAVWITGRGTHDVPLLAMVDAVAIGGVAASVVARASGASRWQALVERSDRTGEAQPEPLLLRRLEAIRRFVGADGAAAVTDAGGGRLDVAAGVGTLARIRGRPLTADDLGAAPPGRPQPVPRTSLPPSSPLRTDGPADLAVTTAGDATVLVSAPTLRRRHARRLALAGRLAATDLERGLLDDAERRSRLGAAHARRHLALLAAASGALARALEDWSPAFADLVSHIVPVHADHAAVDLVIDSGEVRRVAGAHIDPRHAQPARDPGRLDPQWAAGVDAVIRDGRSVLHPQVAAARSAGVLGPGNDRLASLHTALGLDSWTVVPIRTRGLTVGALTVGTVEPRRGLRPSDVAAYEELAGRMAVAIERVLLYRETQEAARTAGDNAGRLGRAVEASPAFAAGLTLGEVVITAAREVVRTMGGIQAAVSVHRRGHPPVIAGWPASPPPHRSPQDTAAFGEAARAGGQPTRGDGDPPWIAVPLTVPGSDTTGTIVVVAAAGHAFSPEEESVLVLLAQVTAAAVGHAELYEALASSEQRLRALIDASPLAILEIGPGEEVVDWNAAASALLRSDPPALHADARRLIAGIRRRLLDAEQVVDERLTLARDDGTTADVSVAAALIGVDGDLLCVVSDITGRLLLEREVQQARRMDALGRLAGGVAHDFNNLLTVIIGYSDLLARTLGPDDPNYPDVDAIRVAGQRAKTFTEQLLTISRRKVVKAGPVDLGAAVAELEGVLRRLIGEDVTLACEVDPDPAHVVIDRGQFEQVLLNLVVNARNAMPGGGRLTIAATHEDDGGRPTAVLTVTDTGVGMEPAVLERCFEPFFTTRERGQGTGLGLATVYGIVEQAKGRIAVDSTVGVGTTFRVSFPEVAPPPGGPASPETPAGEEELRGHGELLLVEDDRDVRAFARAVLEDAGYEVHVAPDAEAALGLVAGLDRLDGVVTDVVMPGLGGRELAAQLTAHRPDLPVLFVSGYDERATHETVPPPRFSRFLPKPFNGRELAVAVRDLLLSAQR